MRGALRHARSQVRCCQVPIDDLIVVFVIDVDGSRPKPLE